MPSSHPDLAAYADLVIYEMRELLNVAEWVAQQQWTFATPADQTLRNALLEAHLVHARCMLEFLTNRDGRKRQIVATHFAPGWDAPNHETLDDLYERICIHLAHLSKDRLESVERERWRPTDVVHAITTAMGDMVQNLKGHAIPLRSQFDALLAEAASSRERLDESGFGQLETSTSPSPGGSLIILGSTGGPPTTTPKL